MERACLSGIGTLALHQATTGTCLSLPACQRQAGPSDRQEQAGVRRIASKASPPFRQAGLPFRQASRIVLLGFIAFVAGCNPPAQQSAQIDLQRCRRENLKLKAKIEQMQGTIANQQRQIETISRLGDKRLEKLFHIVAVELGRYTRGVDLDGKAGDDGIRVYLRPVDRDGDVIKTAGEVKIQLFDLAAPDGERLLGTYFFPVEQVRKHWRGGFLTYHYRFECRWKNPPAHDEITVRVEFIDYLTGKTFTAQKLCKVHLPPSGK